MIERYTGNIGKDTVSLGDATLQSETPASVQQKSAAPLLAGESVTVTDGPADLAALVQKLRNETRHAGEDFQKSRFESAIAALISAAQITDARQKDALERSAALTEKVNGFVKEIEAKKLELAALAATPSDEERQQAAEQKRRAREEIEKDIRGLQQELSAAQGELKKAFAVLDDRSLAVFALSVRVSYSDVRNFTVVSAKEKVDPELETQLDKFYSILNGDDFLEVMLRERGIEA